MRQADKRIGNVRFAPPASDGPSSEPVALRVSPMRQGVRGKNANAVGSVSATKYPSMSRMTCVGLLANTLMAPPAPAGTMAALDLTRPSKELSVETKV